MINYFTLFGIDPKYLIDTAELERKYFALQMKFHPDRSVGQLESDKMQMMQKSADVNEGYRALSDDVERAGHLLELKNIRVNKEKDNTYNPSQALLVEQMELREFAAEIETGMYTKAEILTRVEGEVLSAKKEFNEFFEKADMEQAAQAAMKMKYLDKLKEELEKSL